MLSTFAEAQIVDRLDVVPKETEADIVIRFAQKILYLRHAPQNEGKVLRVFVRLIDSPVPESQLMQETMRSAKSDRVPNVTVVYPELVNGMLVTFSKSTKYKLKPGEDGRSIIVTVPLPPGPKLAAPTMKPAAPVAPAVAAKPAPPAQAEIPAVPPAKPDEDVESRVRVDMDEARQALASKNAPVAINRLNRILGMPASSQTEPAQALIGQAREMNGEALKARAEYELYLKLFPGGANDARVRERLAGLPKDATGGRAAQKALPTEAGPPEWTFFGSVSSYYYTGKSQIETLTPPPPGQLTFNRDTLSAVDQDSLITSTNLNARRRDAYTDTRIVFRNTDNRNFLKPDRSYNRVYSAYIDHTDRRLDYSLRLGRQNPNGMGVLERFDGIQAGYGLSPVWRVNAVYGDAVEFGSPFKKNFYGASVDFVAQSGRPGVSVYGIEQMLDGMQNRRAVGSEVRYFDGKATAYGVLDYDLHYKGVNIALFQGNYLDDAGNNYFFVVDHRRAPSYSLTNALAGAPGVTLNDLVAAQGIAAVREQVVALSALSNMFSVGVTHPLSDRWQVGVDYRLSQISSTRPVQAVIPLAVIGTCVGTIDPVNNNCIFDTASQEGSGKNHVLTFQATGNSLFFDNAVAVANLSLIQAPTYKGQAWALSYVLPFGEQWRVDSNLRYYTQRDNDGGTQDRTSPSLKLSWQWRSSLYLEGEIGYEVSNADGPTRTDHTRRSYIYTGLRWDFR